MNYANELPIDKAADPLSGDTDMLITFRTSNGVVLQMVGKSGLSTEQGLHVISHAFAIWGGFDLPEGDTTNELIAQAPEQGVDLVVVHVGFADDLTSAH